MSATIACISGEEIHRQWDAGRIEGERLGPRATPFGDSGEIFLAHADDVSYYLLPRHGKGLGKTSPARVPDRANIYALKDLGVECVLGWGPGGAITHNIAVGDLVILSDLIDSTYLRQQTFFEDSPLGYVRQFPVFCPQIRQVIGEVLCDMKLVHHPAGTAVVREGPRLETPAEVRMYSTVGAQVVSHVFVPEIFLAKELQMCYAAICYVVNFAESGSRHRPFAAGSLFGPLSNKSDSERLAGIVGAQEQIVRQIALALEGDRPQCECAQSMAGNIRQFDLSPDWHNWFSDSP
jgi:5'-methylthioadenosine phosphorylase